MIFTGQFQLNEDIANLMNLVDVNYVRWFGVPILEKIVLATVIVLVAVMVDSWITSGHLVKTSNNMKRHN